MYKFSVQSIVIILMICSNTQMLGMFQKSNDIKLLECADNAIRGKSLLQQNEYFANLLRPSFKLLEERIKNLSSDIPSLDVSVGRFNNLPIELNIQIIQYCGNRYPLQCLNNTFYKLHKAVKNILMRNFLLTSRIQECEDLKKLFTMYVSVLLVEDRDESFYSNKPKYKTGNYTEEMAAISPYAEGFYFNAGCYRNHNKVNDHDDFQSYIQGNKKLLFFPDYKDRQFLTSVYELGCKRLVEQCEAQLIKCNRFCNSPLITAVLYGDSDKTIELLTYYRDKYDYTSHIYDAIRVAIRYPSNNQEIINILVQYLRDYHQGNGFAYDNRLVSCYPHMLYLADKHKNWPAFDALIVKDPHDVIKNYYGKPYLDSVIKDGILSLEAIKRFEQLCHPQLPPAGNRNCSIQ